MCIFDMVTFTSIILLFVSIFSTCYLFTLFSFQPSVGLIQDFYDFVLLLVGSLAITFWFAIFSVALEFGVHICNFPQSAPGAVIPATSRGE